MATIIDALVVTLSFDNSKYVKGSKEAREELKRMKREITDEGRRIADENKRVADSFQNITKSAIGMFSAVVGVNGIRQFVSQTITGLSQIERQAKATGLSVRDLYAFGSVIQANGGDRNAAQGSVASMSSRLYMARTIGQGVDPNMIGAMQMTGINASDNGIDAVRKFAKFAEGKDPRQVAMIGGFLGLDEATVNQAMKGVKAFDEAMAEAKKTAPTEAEAQKAIAAQKEIAKLQQETVKLGRDLAVEILPGLTSFVHGLDDLITRFPDATKALMAMIAVASGVTAAKTAAGIVTGGAGALGGGLAMGGSLAAMADALPPFAFLSALSYSGGLENSDAGRSARAQMIANKLRARNVGEKDIRSILSGMAAENSALDPGAVNPNAAGDGSHASGLLQLTAARQMGYFKATGKHWKDANMDEQIDWMMREFNGSERGAWNAIHNAPNSTEGGAAYIQRYMRPGMSEMADDLKRANMEATTGVGATVNVGDVVIHTQATDAKGMAGAAVPHLTKAFETAMVNGGLR